MLGTQNLPVFVLAVLALSAIPGPDMMYLMGRSVSQGRGAGLVAVLGIHTAVLCHTVAVALGLSALLAASQAAFDAVKYAGAAYLIFLGVQTLRAKAPAGGVPDLPTPAARVSLGASYRQGFLTGLLNPKTTLFFSALLPQFVMPAAHHGIRPFLFLGLIVIAVSGAFDTAVVLLSAFAGRLLRADARFRAGMKWLTGTLYIGLGLNLLRVKLHRTT